jgi:hypothetical protein
MLAAILFSEVANGTEEPMNEERLGEIRQGQKSISPIPPDPELSTYLC